MLKTTREQLLAAEAAYNSTAVENRFDSCMLIPLENALDAALALVPDPEPVLDAGTLDRSAAIVRAQEIVDGWAASTPERRGIGGTMAGTTMEERTTAVLRLAAFMTGAAGEVW